MNGFCSLSDCHPQLNAPPCSGGKVGIPNYYTNETARIFCAAHASWLIRGPFENTPTAKRMAEIFRRNKTA